MLFVSHNMQAVSTLTHRCVMLQKGRCIAEGSTADVIAEYLRQTGERDLVYTAPPSETLPRVTRVEVRTSLPANVHRHGEPLEVDIEFNIPVPIEGTAVSFQVRNSVSQNIMHVWKYDYDPPICHSPGTYHLTCRIPKARLYMGGTRSSSIWARGPAGATSRWSKRSARSRS